MNKHSVHKVCIAQFEKCRTTNPTVVRWNPVLVSLKKRTEHNLFRTCTKYIVFLIYTCNITNIVMSCDSNAATV